MLRNVSITLGLAAMACAPQADLTPDGTSGDPWALDDASLADVEPSGDDPAVTQSAHAPSAYAHWHLTDQGSTLLTVDRDSGEVLAHVDGDTEVLLDLGEPLGRSVLLGDDLYVLAPTSGAVVALRRDADGTWAERARVTVGTEPYDLALLPDGSALYVTDAQEDTVVRVGTGPMTIAQRVDSLPQPRFVATGTIDGETVLVLTYAYATHVDLVYPDDGHRITEAAMPPVPRFTSTSCAPFQRQMEARVTGRPDVDDDTVYVPVTYADTRLHEHPDNRCPEVPRGEGERPSSSYAPPPDVFDSKAHPNGRFNPAVVRVTVDGDGHAQGDPVAASAREGGSSRIAGRGVAGDVLVAGDEVYVALPAAGRILALSRDGMVSDNALDVARNALRLWDHIPTTLAHDPTTGAFAVASPASRHTTVVPEDWDAIVGDKTFQDIGSPYADVDTYALPAVRAVETQRGEVSFISSEDARVAAPGSGVACASCHPDGRTDGRTWQFSETDHRQTPAITGGIDDTAPFTWTGDNATLELEVELTIAHRMGGGTTAARQTADISAFVRDLPEIPRPDLTPALADAGADVFEAQGCDTCHSGATTTDGQRHRNADDLLVDTPALHGIAATAPYGMRGSYATLDDLLATSHAEGAATVEGEDLEALLAYLSTL